MTDKGVESFEQAWPELDGRLRRMLARKGVRAASVDDIVQETAVRMFEAWDKVDPQRGPWPFAATVAKNLLWDERNRKQPREVVGAVPDTPADYDVERAGLARLELGRVNRALGRLSHNYRSILLAEVGEPLSLEGEPRAINVLRMRARQRLAAVLEKGGSALAGVPAAAKSSLAKLSGFARRNPSTGDAGAAAAVLVVTVVALSGVPDAASPLSPDAEDQVTQGNAISAVSAPTKDLNARAARVARQAEPAESTVAGPARRTIKEVKDTADDVHDAYAGIGENGPVGARVVVDYLKEQEEGGAQGEPLRCALQPGASRVKAGCRVQVAGREGGARATVEIGGGDQ